MELVLKHSAVLIAPNHRLLPESTGHDILEDISDVWKWVQNNLQSYVLQLKGGDGVETDLSRIWSQGESAGIFDSTSRSMVC